MATQPLINLSDANAGWGTITYNGYTFSGLRDVKLSGGEWYDPANRAVIGTRYRLLVHWFPVDANESAHATAMILMRAALKESGQALLITGMGFGDIAINSPGSTNNKADLENGPKPGELSLTQIGLIATECFWDLTFTIKEGIGTQGNIASFTYGVDWSLDDAGLTTRTYTGALQILAPRVAGSRLLSTSADQYRDQINVITPPGMKRTTRKFTLSKDRTTLDFSISDMQLEAEAPPAGVLSADLDYEIESVPPGFSQFQASLSGSITVPSGVPPINAANAFMRIFIDKQAKLAAIGNEGTVIPTRIRFGRGLGSRVSNFAVSWTLTGCLDDMLRNGGIWEAISGTNWQSWAQSMIDAGVWGNRGTAGLYYNSSEDAIVDLNRVGPLPSMGGGGTDTSIFASGTSVFSMANITAARSWLYYKNGLKPIRDHNAITHRTMEDYRPNTLGAGDLLNDTGVSMAQSGISAGSPSQITQYQGRPKDYILMQGKAMRIQFPPAIPRLVQVAGLPVQEVKVRIDGPKVEACIFGAKVYSARWAILYRLTEGYLSSIPALPSATLCCANTDAKANS